MKTRPRTLFAVTLAALALGAGGAAVVDAPADAAPRCPSAVTAQTPRSATVAALRDTCSQGQFDRLFRSAEAGRLPLGVMNGQARPVGPPNTAASNAIAAVWGGKTFHRGWLNNRALGGEIVPADVFYARSSVDGRRAIRIDYRRSGLPAAHDEIRRLPNGVYLGYGFLNGGRAVDFWLWK